MTSLSPLHPRPQARPITHRSLGTPPPSARAGGHMAQLLAQLTRIGLLGTDAAESFLHFHGDRLTEFNSLEKVGKALVTAGLLTAFQLQRVLGGQFHGMVLGNYRLLDQ